MVRNRNQLYLLQRAECRRLEPKTVRRDISTRRGNPSHTFVIHILFHRAPAVLIKICGYIIILSPLDGPASDQLPICTVDCPGFRGCFNHDCKQSQSEYNIAQSRRSFAKAKMLCVGKQLYLGALCTSNNTWHAVHLFSQVRCF
jgi:hypothetical protein